MCKLGQRAEGPVMVGHAREGSDTKENGAKPESSAGGSPAGPPRTAARRYAPRKWYTRCIASSSRFWRCTCSMQYGPFFSNCQLGYLASAEERHFRLTVAKRDRNALRQHTQTGMHTRPPAMAGTQKHPNTIIIIFINSTNKSYKAQEHKTTIQHKIHNQ